MCTHLEVASLRQGLHKFYLISTVLGPAQSNFETHTEWKDNQNWALLSILMKMSIFVKMRLEANFEQYLDVLKYLIYV